MGDDRLVVGYETGAGLALYALDAGAPHRLHRVDIDGEEIRIDVDRDRVYATVGPNDFGTRESSLHLFEVQQDRLRAGASVVLDDYRGDVEAYGDYLYVTNRKLMVFDVRDLDAPRLLDEVDEISSRVTLAAGGGLLFGSGSAIPNAMIVWDLSDPAHPRRTGTIEFEGPVDELSFASGFVFAANGPWGVRAFDVTDPANPTPVADLETVGRAWGADFVGDHAYVADTYAGLQVFRLGCDPTD